ncbi:MAG: neutral/alkaline non-lysosomal ceramidase N-terminal domain-containing protein [Thermodesulfobacteriota bacterium]|nr:neutral/alkaline non-lysosomal ceramidase N-terminal domain-containing protein [Thermodesulfobacteriota bacterium]
MKAGLMLRAGILSALLMTVITGCAGYHQAHLTIHRVPPLPVQPGECLMAGAVRVDITPPPGISMAGYSVMAGVGQGFRNRLSARAIYIRSAEGSAVALVQCDLLSGSLLLHHKVAELVAEQTDVPASGLMLAGTHTHSGPGNYFASNFYNRFAASQKGFDPELFEFLSMRIAGAVVDACRNSRSARIATGKVQILGKTRNRSMAAYRANFEDINGQVADPLTAVNPVLTMIRIDLLDDRGRYLPAGAFSSFSIHPTAVSSKNDLYSADIFGFIAKELETELEKAYDTQWPMVHAVVNGTHADNSPNDTTDTQGYHEARRIGTAIGERAVALFSSLTTAREAGVTVRSLCREVDLFRNRTIDGVSLCKRPMVGNALLAGAEDGRHPVLQWLPFFHEGWASARWLFTGSCQGHKRIAGGWFQPLILDKQDFPHRLFLQVIQVGDTVLLPFPFEITCQAGAGITAGIENGIKTENNIVVISCANGYFGYATTRAEYARQHYEGGHTLYGPETGAFLAKQAASLITDLEAGDSINSSQPLPAAWQFDLSARTGFPEMIVPKGARKALAEPVSLPASGHEAASWQFRWQDVPPCRIAFHNPLVRLETSTDGRYWDVLYDENGLPVGDNRSDFAVRFCGRITSDNMGSYEADWYYPVLQPGRLYRFAILPRDGRGMLYSAPFPDVAKDITGD